MCGINKGLGALNELLPEPLKSSGGGRSTGSGRIVSGRKVDWRPLRRHFFGAFRCVEAFARGEGVVKRKFKNLYKCIWKKEVIFPLIFVCLFYTTDYEVHMRKLKTDSFSDPPHTRDG
ncbi:hypothetical protein TNCT_609791 [Trichonephila clavata]|uniref:Uncharacterized protein n=1 Tax=Trichonephila clavata TaxID=2740835 RepID=A0A8X6FS12_TRICU|nr:hypothetical protein TNCT_609791 [Trichonephila clavata]